MNPKRIGLELYTERLVLRELDSTDASDAAFVLQLVNDPGFIKGIADVGVRDRAGASNYIERACETFFTRFGFGMYGVALRAARAEAQPADSDTQIIDELDGAQARPHLIGLMGLLQRETLDVPDLGFAFLGAHCRQGYAVEAGRAALFDARERVGLDRLVAITDHDNVASQATLHRLGFAYEREVALPPNKKPLMLFATHLSGRSLSAPSVKP
jgi:[ribosomal protein S5]-alanine N-acetyltransferase